MRKALLPIVMGAFLGGTATLRAAIPPDLLDYVDTASPAYLRYKQWVDSVVFNGSSQYGFSASDAAYLFRLNGNPAYCTHAVGRVENQVAAAEAEIAAGRRPAISYDSYLEVGGMISDLALAYDWCAAQTTPAQRTRWAAYAQQAVWNVWNHSQASWGGQPFPWSGWSVNDPGNNYHYSFLEATMYWHLASNDASWRQFLETQKFPPLASFFAQLTGGGSREGTGYGLAHRRLFGLYRLWRKATGTDLAAQNSHARDSIDFWIHATVPTLDRFAPIGDQSRESYPALFDYHRALMLEARAAITDAAAQQRASGWLSRISVPRMQYGFNFRYDLLPAGGSGTIPTPLHYHATGTGNLFARTSWAADAMWLHFIAGPYDQSHAHQEQGGFTLFARDFLAVTENIFSHSGLQQGTDTHNVLRFVRNGSTVAQRVNTASTMTLATEPDGTLSALAELAPAYGNNSPIQQWRRELRLRQRTLRVHDLYTVSAGTTAIFQINTPVRPIVTGNSARAGDLAVRVLVPAAATLSVVDWRSVNPQEFAAGGYKLEVNGGTGEYLVELIDAGADAIFADGFGN